MESALFFVDVILLLLGSIYTGLLRSGHLVGERNTIMLYVMGGVAGGSFVGAVAYLIWSLRHGWQQARRLPSLTRRETR